MARHARPGVLSQDLRDALGMEEGAPPPWLINMQVREDRDARGAWRLTGTAKNLCRSLIVVFSARSAMARRRLTPASRFRGSMRPSLLVRSWLCSFRCHVKSIASMHATSRVLEAKWLLIALPVSIVPGTGGQFGYHPGGWGKPPVDEFGSPIYGDVFGQGTGDGDEDDLVSGCLSWWHRWMVLFRLRPVILSTKRNK